MERPAHKVPLDRKDRQAHRDYKDSLAPKVRAARTVSTGQMVLTDCPARLAHKDPPAHRDYKDWLDRKV